VLGTGIWEQPITLVQLLRKWVVATPVTGKRALIVAVAAVGLPTILRASLEGMVTATGFLPYFPFLLVAAVLVEWKVATIIMLAAAGVADWLFVGPHHPLFQEPSRIFGLAMFLASSVLIIALVHAIRSALHDLVGPTANDGVIFSLKDGQAWASWPTAGFHLRLGPQDHVRWMMNDFIAQVELSERLAKAAKSDCGR